MKNIEKIMIKAIEAFSGERNIRPMAALIGGQAVIIHGVPRTTIDTDTLLYFQSDASDYPALIDQFAAYLEATVADRFDIRYVRASRDPSDPLEHPLIRITDRAHEHLRLDMLFANYQWEVEGLAEVPAPDQDGFYPFPKPYLIGLKLLAGGALDHEDIRHLLMLMEEDGIKKAFEIASMIRKNMSLKEIYDPICAKGSKSLL